MNCWNKWLCLYALGNGVSALAASPQSHNEADELETPRPEGLDQPLRSSPQNHDFAVFRLSTDTVNTVGKNQRPVGIPLKQVLVQSIPNLIGSGNLCHPIFIEPQTKPCADGQLLISFVRDSNTKNTMIHRGKCFCLSSNLLNSDNENQALSPIALPTPEDINVFDESKSELFALRNAKNQSVAQLGGSLYARRHDGDSDTVQRFQISETQILRPNPDETEYQLIPDYTPHGEAMRKTTQHYATESIRSFQWTDVHTKERRDPFPVGIGSLGSQKDTIFDEYLQRSVFSLGSNHSGWATFYNAWKLSRLTRSNNNISLEQINNATKATLDRRFQNAAITARLLPKYKAFNEYIWQDMHRIAQKGAPEEPSEAVDIQFQSALNGEGHEELWNRIAAIENETLEVQIGLNTDFKNHMHLTEVNEISDYNKSLLVAGAPSTRFCTRDFTSSNFSSDSCPCRPKATTVPCNYELPSLKKDFVQNRITCGHGKTYLLVNEYALPETLRSATFVARRTGYSQETNTPAFTSKAGFAAVKRLNHGRDGKAVLGQGTLDSPITAAISPATAKNHGVCQGDMLHDPDYGWLRVEGGCTNSGLGDRVDVWRGSASIQRLSGDALLNSMRKFRHFPAGLIDANYAAENPK